MPTHTLIRRRFDMTEWGSTARDLANNDTGQGIGWWPMPSEGDFTLFLTLSGFVGTDVDVQIRSADAPQPANTGAGSNTLQTVTLTADADTNPGAAGRATLWDESAGNYKRFQSLRFAPDAVTAGILTLELWVTTGENGLQVVYA